MGNLLGAIGQAKPVSEFINTAGQYQATQSNLESQRLMQQMETMKMQQLERDNKEYHVDAAISAFPEEQREPIKKMWQMSGLIDTNGIIRGKDVRSTPDLYKKYPDQALATNLIEVDKLEKKNKSLSTKMDPASQEELKSNIDALTDLHKKIALIRGKYQTVLAPGASLVENGQITLTAPEKTNTRFIPIYDPSSPTEYSYGNPNTGEITEMAAPPPRSAAEKDNPFNSWKEAFIESTGRKPNPKEVMDWHRSGGVNVNIGDQSGKLDVKVAEGAIAKLPELRKDASLAKSGVAKIEKMFTLLDAGAGGKMGQVRALIAPYAEALGISSREMNDAKTYEVLARTIGGSMRMEIVGPGQVSNYENQLLQTVSGGGANGIAAARELLNFYRNEGLRKIGDYNDMVDSVSQFSPATGKLYKKIPTTGVGSATTPGAGRFQILKVE